MLKRSLLKNILYTIGFVLILYACNDASSHTEKKPEPEDSLQYYPATPKPLDKQVYRHYYRTLTSFFDSLLIRRGFNGGILVAKEGSIIYEKYVGFHDLRKKDPLTDTSTFHIASTSKTFMGIAVLRLVQEKKLSLQDSIQTFFPGLPYPGITVKMLLDHRSGLPNYLYFITNKNWDKNKMVTNVDVLNFLYTQHPNRSGSPNRGFSYCNTNFVLLALIVEKLTGQPYPQYMHQKYFAPLHMDHTFVFTLADSARVSPSFNYNSTAWANDIFEGTYGDKNIYSTPQDLLKWDQALYTDQLIGKPLLDSAFTPNSNDRPSIHNYGLGFRMLMLHNGKKVIYHFGRWHGFNAAFARLIDEKVTIIILGNKFNRGIYNTAHKAYDLFGDYGQGGKQEEEEPETPVGKKKAN